MTEPAKNYNDPAPPHRETTSGAPPTGRSRLIGRERLRSPLFVLILIGLCVLSAAVVMAIAGGLRAGQQTRDTYATQTTVAEIDLQYRLGLDNLAAGDYGLAAQRLSWVLERAPGYLDAAERLAEARSLGEGGVEAVVATPIPPSEADTLGEQFDEARAFYQRGEYEAAIDRLQTLQAIDPTYRTGEVQEMLYDALTTLGVRYIRSDDRLEEGIFLLEQASAIRPLDNQTDGERLLATFYITGEQYWGLNWAVVIRNFEEIYAVAPNYQDVATRLRQAYIRYGDQLAIGGAPCDAVSLYESAQRLQNDTDIQAKLDAAVEACENPSPTPAEEENGLPGEETPGGGEVTPPPDETPPPTEEGQ